MSIDELHSLRDRYEAKYNKELQKAKIRNNKPTGNTIGVKF